MNEKNQERELARLYYLQGYSQKTIAERLEVGENTVSRWARDGHWEEKKAALNVTRPEIVNKILLLISKILDKVESLDNMDPGDLAKLISQIQKLSNSIEKLDKSATVMDNIETFRNFNRWLEERMQYDDSITPQFLQKVTELQDKFITDQFNKKK